MSGLARGRLMAERKEFRKNRPFGFVAKPVTKPDGSQDLLEWECLVPGKEGTLFAGASYPITMTFTDSYPETPPYIRLHLIDGKPLCHPNIYPSGKLCLSITNTKEDHGTWMPSTTIRVILLAIQTLLDEKEVNPKSPAQTEAFVLFEKNRVEWKRRVRLQVAKLSSSNSVSVGGAILVE